jgi:hypothetical protein
MRANQPILAFSEHREEVLFPLHPSKKNKMSTKSKMVEAKAFSFAPKWLKGSLEGVAFLIT